MPQLVVIAVGVLSLYFAFRWVRRDAARVEGSFQRMERRVKKNKRVSATHLTLDPISGVYRPQE